MNSPAKKPTAQRRWPWLLILTVIAAVIRCIKLGSLGIDHFDEGIYASAGAWALDRNGLASLDPGVIPYAPPVFPILVGLTYKVIGFSDFAAIVPSLMAGVAMVPLIGWVCGKWLGRSVGLAAAFLACFSGPHIVFSRMALTDASFALVWVLAIAAGVWFLSKPGRIRAGLMGLAVGLAQLTKYNGWLVGAIVILAAVVGAIVHKEQRSRANVLKTFGWGFLGALVAAIVYLPWFRFVESHGGYSDLLRHQRSYLGTVSSWPGHLATQLRQAIALQPMALGVGVLALWACIVLLWRAKFDFRRNAKDLAFLTLFIASLMNSSTWWTGLVLAPILLLHAGAAQRVTGVWWIVLSILTPFYHPYARLWLPLEIVGWIGNGLIFISLWHRVAPSIEPVRLEVTLASGRFVFAMVATMVFGQIALNQPRHFLSGTESRDSLRIAAYRFAADFPPGVSTVRTLARPALYFYLTPSLGGRGVAMSRAGSLSDLAAQPGAFAVLDSVQLLQEIPDPAKREGWLKQFDVLKQTRDELSSATLLDIDPNAANGDLSSRTQEILLLRRKAEK